MLLVGLLCCLSLETPPFCPDGNPHTWDLWVDAPMKILLFILLTASSLFPSLLFFFYTLIFKLVLSTVLIFVPRTWSSQKDNFCCPEEVCLSSNVSTNKFWWLNSFCRLQKGDVIKQCYRTVLCRKSSSQMSSAFWHSLGLRWICWKVVGVFHLLLFLLFL